MIGIKSILHLLSTFRIDVQGDINKESKWQMMLTRIKQILSHVKPL